jgi:hypothetical protein
MMRQGARFRPITDAMQFNQGTYNTRAKPTEIRHQKGQVLLLGFWKSSNTACFRPMAQKQQMIARRGREWADSVRLVSLNMD